MAIPRNQVRFAKPLPHPGIVLAMDYMEPLELTPYALAQRMHVARQRIERLSRGEQALTADTALRLSRVFTNTSAAFWMNLQAAHDLSEAEIKAADALDEIEAFDQAS
jgi:antitoxin HigA-1